MGVEEIAVILNGWGDAFAVLVAHLEKRGLIEKSALIDELIGRAEARKAEPTSEGSQRFDLRILTTLAVSLRS